MGDVVIAVNGEKGTGAELFKGIGKSVDKVDLSIHRQYWDIRITKEDGASMGMNLKQHDDFGRVADIAERGVLGLFNKANPDKAVANGDIVLDASNHRKGQENGRTCTDFASLVQTMKGTEVTLRVLRLPSCCQ